MASERGEQILREAARLFRERGFHGVGIDDIGEAVGITGPGIYRHFQNKQQLLDAIVENAIDLVAEQMEGVIKDGLVDLVELATMTVQLCLRHRDLMAAYVSRPYLLSPSPRSRLVVQRKAMSSLWRQALLLARPDISSPEATFRTIGANGIASVLLSSGRPLRLPDLQHLYVELMVTAMREPSAAALAQPSPEKQTRVRTNRDGTHRAQRRDQVLEQAVRLFSEQGYPSVSVEAIGAAAGLDQSSIYRHYSGKAEMLVAALELGASRLDLGIVEMHEENLQPGEQLAHLVAGYVDSALANSAVIGVWVTESVYLEGSERAQARRRQRRYIEVWYQAMKARWPDIEPLRAELTARAVFGLINACVSIESRGRLSQVRRRQLLCQISLACLEVGRPPP